MKKLSKHIEESFQPVNEWGASASVIDRIVDSYKTDWDKNKTPLAFGDYVMFTYSRSPFHTFPKRLWISNWCGSGVSMKKDSHHLSIGQYGTTTNTEDILKLTDSQQKIAEVYQALVTKENSGDAGKNMKFTGWMRDYQVIMFFEKNKICVQLQSNKYHQAKEEDLTKTEAVCKKFGAEFKGTIDLTTS